MDILFVPFKFNLDDLPTPKRKILGRLGTLKISSTCTQRNLFWILSNQPRHRGVVPKIHVWKTDFYFLSNCMEYDRGDSFPYGFEPNGIFFGWTKFGFFEPNGILFGSKSIGKLSPISYSVWFEWKFYFSKWIGKIGTFYWWKLQLVLIAIKLIINV